jgi:hypothetical protein
MKRRSRLRLVTRASSPRLSLPRALPVAIIPQSISLDPNCDNGLDQEQTYLLERTASRRFHLFPKGAALLHLLGKDAIRRLFDFI